MPVALADKCLAVGPSGWQALLLAVRMRRLELIAKGIISASADEPLPFHPFTAARG